MEKHIRLLGVLNIAWGACGVLAALFLTVLFGGAIGVISWAARHEAEVGTATTLMGLLGGLVVLVILLASAPSVIVGVGLLRVDGWARIVGLILSGIHLLAIPFGTALGIYGLWVLLSEETSQIFSRGRQANPSRFS